MTTQRCKGARDLLPEDTRIFRHIEDMFRRSCLNWGYQEVRTPTLEYLHLFTAAGTLTPNMLRKVYSFLDWDGWSGERVVLRPDGTIPVARLYTESLSQEEIARLFYVTNVFAFEETGKEDRERWQCGVELLGSPKRTADAELISLALETLRTLNISGVELQLSHAGVLKALLQELGLSPDEEAGMLDQILDGNWETLKQRTADDPDGNRLLSLLLDLTGKSSGFLENIKALPQISFALQSELDSFAEVTALLDALDCDYNIDVTSTRGFEYYTGLCFQFLDHGHKIGSGGRYDNLVPLIGGKSTPACGFALYVDALMHLVEATLPRKTSDRVLVRNETSSQNMVKTTFQLAGSLREAGYITELDVPSSQRSCRWAITVQEKPSPFVVTDQMHSRTREASSIADVIAIIGGSA